MLKHTLRSAFRTVWTALIFRDHWQGEVCVASAGAVGWGVLSFIDTGNGAPQYELLFRIAPEHIWGWALIIAGLVQLWGLTRKRPLLRIVGAFGVFLGLSCVFYSLLIEALWSKALSVYLACVLIEAAAFIYQVAGLARRRSVSGGRLRWTFRP